MPENFDYSKEQEFWKNVSPQNDIPLVGENKAFPIGDFKELCQKLSETELDHFEKTIIEEVTKKPKLIKILRLLILKTETRLELDLSYILRETRHEQESLCGCPETDFTHHKITALIKWITENTTIPKKIKTEIFKYFFDNGLSAAITPYTKQVSTNYDQLDDLIEQDLRQAYAKRRGHGAEKALATVIDDLGCKIWPEDKLENPMGGDVRLDNTTFERNQKPKAKNTTSYDIVIPRSGKAKICIISLIHTSNPGQYGKEKIGNTRKTMNLIKKYNQSHEEEKIKLCALTDGSGFSMSKGNVTTLVENVDDIIQLKTLYKIGMILHENGLCKIKAVKLDSGFYGQETIEKIKEKYIPDDVEVVEEAPKNCKEVKAGVATLYL